MLQRFFVKNAGTLKNKTRQESNKKYSRRVFDKNEYNQSSYFYCMFGLCLCVSTLWTVGFWLLPLCMSLRIFLYLLYFIWWTL